MLAAGASLYGYYIIMTPMITAFSMILHLVKIWWREFTPFIILNIICLLLQFLIITGPPATALMYAVARVAVNDDLIEFSTFWKSFKSLFIPAWKLGLLNLAVFGIIIINYNFYQNYAGL